MNLEFSNLYSIYMLIFGLVVGSFLNVIIIRLPKTLKVIWAKIFQFIKTCYGKADPNVLTVIQS